jgi:hypothetical protein
MGNAQISFYSERTKMLQNVLLEGVEYGEVLPSATGTCPAWYTAPLRTNAESPGDRSRGGETLNPISDEK